MTDTGSTSTRRRRGRFGPWLLVTLALVMAVAWTALRLLSGDAIVAPTWVTQRIEARASEALGGAGRLDIGSIVATLGEGYVPRLVVRDLRLSDPAGAEIGRVPEIRARFSPEVFAGGDLALTRLTVVGADLIIRRTASGRFDLAFGQGDGLRGPGSVAGVVAGVDRAFAAPLLSKLDRITGETLRLTFQDALTGRVWRAENGTLALQQENDRRSLSLGFSLAGGGGEQPASIRLTATAPRGSGGLDLAATVSGVAAADLAGQVPPLAFLAAADAPLSANLRGLVGPDGALRSFAGAIEVGSGAIRPDGGARPVPFDGAKAYISYDPAAGRIEFSDVSATLPEARFRASGKALLRGIDPTSGLPSNMVMQFALSEIELDPAGELAEPARFQRGALDLRLTPSPFRMELGQLSLSGEGTTFQASGDFRAGTEGWEVALDLALDRIAHDRLLALWPLRVVPKTREWLTENVTEGLLSDVRAGLRLAQGEEPRVALGYTFRDGTVRFLRTLPPIVRGAGHASITGNRYAMTVTDGYVAAPNGGRIDTGGSAFVVPDISQKPANAEVRLNTRSSIPAALALLDERPFEFLKKAGRTPDLAEGRADLETLLRLPLARDVRPDDVYFEVGGQLSDVRSETLVPGRVLTAPALAIEASPDKLSISGEGRVGEARFDAAWTLPLGRGSGTGSSVEGRVTLDSTFLDEFGIALPAGMVSGSGTGRIALELPRDGPASFALRSDLSGIALSVPALNWSKGSGQTGTLEVAGSLGSPASVERLELTAPGLSAAGSIALGAGGGFSEARFDRVRAGRWLDAPVVLSGRGAGQPVGVAVTGGTIDLRETEFASGGGGQGGPIRLSLDRLIVSDGIILSGLDAELSTGGGLSGRFSGRLAGEAPVTGVLAPTREGTGVRIQAQDAGAVLRAAGLLESARRGTLDMTLVPLRGEGRYDGRLTIRDLGLRGAPVLADLLSAVSVVGLLEQLNGQGITFGEVTGEFTLEPRGITLRRGSAVGASLGVSMSGVYDLRRKWIDMQGTISPIYLINGIGQIFTRRGEGLFGFNYRMTGPASAPGTSVNPLSILTPGMFRELFRAAPPRLGQ